MWFSRRIFNSVKKKQVWIFHNTLYKIKFPIFINQGKYVKMIKRMNHA